MDFGNLADIGLPLLGEVVKAISDAMAAKAEAHAAILARLQAARASLVGDRAAAHAALDAAEAALAGAPKAP